MQAVGNWCSSMGFGVDGLEHLIEPLHETRQGLPIARFNQPREYGYFHDPYKGRS